MKVYYGSVAFMKSGAMFEWIARLPVGTCTFLEHPDPFYVVFENKEDVLAFKLKFGL